MSGAPDFYTPQGRPSKVRHGDPGAYTRYGCRCERCTEANAAAMVRWRATGSTLKGRGEQ